MEEKKSYLSALFLVSLVLIFFGSYLGKFYHTSGGDVLVRDIQFVTEDGALMRSLLYVPKSATIENPAPAVVGVHGFNNTAELQGMNAIELSRRGFVVIAPDQYGHGNTGFADTNINNGVVMDMGVYAAMQYLKTLPYVDTKRVGLVGHSMGGTTVQWAALRAWQNYEAGMDVIAPIAVLPTSQSWMLNPDKTFELGKYPINTGVVYGQFDEWAKGMWGVDKGSLANTTENAAIVTGVQNPEFGKYYAFANSAPITREQAIQTAETGAFRVMYSPPVVHPRVHMSSEAASYIVDFFDITLLGGKSPIPATDQKWLGKEISTGIAYIGYFIFVVTLGLLLLQTNFFKTIIRPEPASPSNPKDSKGWTFYTVIYLLCLLPAPLVYNWATGYPIDIQAMGRAVPTVFPANTVFPMPTANGLVIFNLIVGATMLIVFLLTYKFYMKQNGVTFANLGVGLPAKEVGKALLLAVVVFLSGYALLVLADYFFKVDFRYFVFSIKTLTSPKVFMMLKYLPFWAFVFMVSSLTLNSFTRIEGKKEWLNIILMVVASCGGLAVFNIVDYGALFSTGIKMWTTVPYPAGTTSALAGVLLWGLLFILPISAVIARIFFKKTGSIWLGGFINAFIITFFAISNTVISGGVVL